MMVLGRRASTVTFLLLSVLALLSSRISGWCCPCRGGHGAPRTSAASSAAAAARLLVRPACGSKRRGVVLSSSSSSAAAHPDSDPHPGPLPPPTSIGASDTNRTTEELFSRSLAYALCLTFLWGAAASNRMGLGGKLPAAVLETVSAVLSTVWLGGYFLKSSWNDCGNPSLPAGCKQLSLELGLLPPCPLVPTRISSLLSQLPWRAGVELAAWRMFAIVLYLISVLSAGISPGSAGACSQLVLLFVPIGERFALRKRVRKTLWAAASLAFVGGCLLSEDVLGGGAAAPSRAGISRSSLPFRSNKIGIGVCLLAAGCQAAYELRLTHLAGQRQRTSEVLPLVFTQQLFLSSTIVLALLLLRVVWGWVPAVPHLGGLSLIKALLACILGGAVAGLSAWGRAFAQPHLGATRSSSIFSLQELWLHPWGFSQSSVSGLQYGLGRTGIAIGACLAMLPNGWKGLEEVLEVFMQSAKALASSAREKLDAEKIRRQEMLSQFIKKRVKKMPWKKHKKEGEASSTLPAS